MKITPSKERSAIMRAVRSKDTKPEIAVRRTVHSLGYRYRLHRKDLPGCPDLTFTSKRKVIFVNGCFWHHHDCPRGDRNPKSNSTYWRKKIATNVQRDRKNLLELDSMGRDSMVVWECEIGDLHALHTKLSHFLSSST